MTLPVYTCAQCGDECISDRPDGQAVAEYEARHREAFDPAQTIQVCEECFRRFEAWVASLPQEQQDEIYGRRRVN
jgi:hypothetical protein